MSESRRFLRKQEKQRAPSDKRSVLLTAGGVRFWSKESSIEHGGTGTLFNFMALLAL